MKKIIIASAIILASGVTAWSVNKQDNTVSSNIDTQTIKADMVNKANLGVKQDIGTIQ